jgi:hypothetical protein
MLLCTLVCHKTKQLSRKILKAKHPTTFSIRMLSGVFWVILTLNASS